MANLVRISRSTVGTSGRRILRTPDAAAYVGLSASTLEKMRCRGDGPQFTRLGSRAVGYDVKDLDAWIEAQSEGSEIATNPPKSAHRQAPQRPR